MLKVSLVSRLQAFDGRGTLVREGDTGEGGGNTGEIVTSFQNKTGA